jgi:alanyl-tRNA synthetase
VERLRFAEKEIERVRVQQLLSSAAPLAGQARDVFGVAFVGQLVGRGGDGASAGDVRRLALDIRGRLAQDRPGVVALVGSANDRAAVVVAVNDAARSWGISANALVKVAAGALGGSGGGKDDVAQGGGTDLAQVDRALVEVEHEVGRAATQR